MDAEGFYSRYLMIPEVRMRVTTRAREAMRGRESLSVEEFLEITQELKTDFPEVVEAISLRNIQLALSHLELVFERNITVDKFVEIEDLVEEQKKFRKLLEDAFFIRLLISRLKTRNLPVK